MPNQFDEVKMVVDDGYPDEPYLGGALANVSGPEKTTALTDPRMTLRSRIAMRRKEHQTQLDLLAKLEQLLDDNKAIEEFQNLVNKLHL